MVLSRNRFISGLEGILLVAAFLLASPSINTKKTAIDQTGDKWLRRSPSDPEERVSSLSRVIPNTRKMLRSKNDGAINWR